MTAHSSDIDPQHTTAAPADPESEAADFLERLGDLDQFIGAAPASGPTQLPSFAGPRNASIPSASRPLPSVDQPVTRRLFEAPTGEVPAVGAQLAAAPSDQHSDEAEDFLQRLGDLDRFIAPSQPEAAAPDAPSTPDADDEAADFLQRLSDLDRFIGPGN